MARFPFRRSVGQNLRDLFAHDRLNAQTNHLGYSSLSPGEGSFDILDAAGNVITRYGHHAGRAGFLVPDGAGWQTVQEHVAAVGAAAAERLDAHAQRIGAVENRASALESRAGTLEGRADSHASRIGAAENDITALQTGKVSQSTHNALAARVGTAEGRLDSQASRIGRAENTIDTVQTKLLALINDLRAEHGKAPANPDPIPKG